MVSLQLIEAKKGGECLVGIVWDCNCAATLTCVHKRLFWININQLPFKIRSTMKIFFLQAMDFISLGQIRYSSYMKVYAFTYKKYKTLLSIRTNMAAVTYKYMAKMYHNRRISYKDQKLKQKFTYLARFSPINIFLIVKFPSARNWPLSTKLSLTTGSNHLSIRR